MSTSFSTSKCLEAIQDLYRDAEAIDKRARGFVGNAGNVELFLKIRKPFEETLGNLMYDIIRYNCNDLSINDLKMKVQEYQAESQKYLNKIIILSRIINSQNG